MAYGANFAAGSEPDGATLLEIFKTATTIRRTDELFLTMLGAGDIAITYYSPRGQEVIPSAISAHLHPTDYLVTVYRGIHDAIAKGVPLDQLWAEFLGRSTGTCKGKGGPMHLTHPESGLMVTTGIVGGGLPIANGLALSAQMRNEDRVTICNFGDGATNIGAFHESMNLASLWNLPVIFVCQNNLYGEKTKFANHTKVPSIAQRGDSYDMPAVRVDGNDAAAMWKASGEAIARARSGGGPTLIEAMTFRFRGHLFGDDGSYIAKEEFDDALTRDSVPRLRRSLLEQAVATEAELLVIEEEIEAKVQEAARFALDSPFAGAEELGRDIYAEEVPV